MVKLWLGPESCIKVRDVRDEEQMGTFQPSV